MKPNIPYTRPSITNLEIGYATDAAANGWGSNCYDYLHKFEAAFADHLGVKHAIATSSCTGALHMGLAAMGIGPGDEVIVPDTTWVATVAPVVHIGATPVFVDINAESWCIDPQKVRAAITTRTKAIIGVHLYGNLCDMQALQQVSQETGVPIIEDAAEGVGSVFAGRRAGSMGLFGTFSFHGTKTMTTGEGGMFVTNDSTLYDTVTTLSNHGRVCGQTRQFWFDMIGFKYKMSNVQAAIGLGQIERIDELIQRKKEILMFYRERLSHISSIQLNPEPLDGENGGWMPSVVADSALGVTREMFKDAFESENIDARVFFYPLSSFKMFDSCPQNRVAYDISTRAFNLPSFHDMTEEQMIRVSSVVEKVING